MQIKVGCFSRAEKLSNQGRPGFSAISRSRSGKCNIYNDAFGMRVNFRGDASRSRLFQTFRRWLLSRENSSRIRNDYPRDRICITNTQNELTLMFPTLSFLRTFAMLEPEIVSSATVSRKKCSSYTRWLLKI